MRQRKGRGGREGGEGDNKVEGKGQYPLRHQADKLHASGALHAKEELGRGGGAHREWCSGGERGEGERLCVSAWCLREV